MCRLTPLGGKMRFSKKQEKNMEHLSISHSSGFGGARIRQVFCKEGNYILFCAKFVLPTTQIFLYFPLLNHHPQPFTHFIAYHVPEFTVLYMPKKHLYANHSNTAKRYKVCSTGFRPQDLDSVTL